MRRNAVTAFAAALCGFAWGHQAFPAFAALAAAIPLLWGIASNRWAAGGIALAYFLAASRGLPYGAGIFFAETEPASFGWALWVGSGAVNAAIWAAAWHGAPRRRAIGAVVALIVTAVPPIGIIGWTNPLTAAGWLFPAMSFIGVVFMAAFAAATAARRWAEVAMLVGAALIANACAFAWPKPPAPQLTAWSSQNTQFQRLQSGIPAQINARLQLVLDLVQQIPEGHAVVLPETILPAETPSTSFAWLMLGDASEKLRDKGSLILVGTELVKPGQAVENVLLPLGSQDTPPLVQRVPVPIGMWRPWAKAAETYKADLLGSGIAKLHGVKVAYSICYEQLLVWPVLVSMAHRPTVLIGAANDWWARDTSIPTIQAQSLDAWGRLFGVPVLKATNL